MSSESKGPRGKDKNDPTVDLLSSIASIPMSHVTINPELSTPYDAYWNFVAKVKENFKPEQIVQINEIVDQDSPSPDIISPSYACCLAYQQLKTLLGME